MGGIGLETSYDSLKHQLFHHPLYEEIRSLESLQVFMEHHSVCVWDFMVLVKSLQHELTGSSFPWVPVQQTTFARFMNEIVLDEETDIGPEGKPISHFEWYLKAMDEVGANTLPIRKFLSLIQSGKSCSEAHKEAKMPLNTLEHCQFILDVCKMPLPIRISIFYHSRESLIPYMFEGITAVLKKNQLPCPWLLQYLERHMQCDAEVHGPLAEKMYENYCGHFHSAERLMIEQYTTEAFNQRIKLWNKIGAELRSTAGISS